MTGQQPRREHHFNIPPKGWLPTMGIPVYMDCLCGVRFYSHAHKPKSACRLVPSRGR